MSRIYFRTENEGVAELCGAERAYGALLTTRVAAAVIPSMLGYKTREEHPIARHLPPSWRPFHDDFPAEVARGLEANWGGEVSIAVDGGRLSGFSLLGNTALRLGSDPVRLLVRLHCACEVHAWVDGPNRAWLAGIIELGRKSGVLRANMGWEDVARLLRASDAAPVVTSYSVCDGFPNRAVADWVPPDDNADPQDLWEELPRAERWALSMVKLREREAADPDGYLELRPDTWETFYFGAKVSVLDLVDRDFRAGLAAQKAASDASR